MLMRISILLFILYYSSTLSIAQQRTISGTILDADTKAAIEFCNVLLSQEQKGTLTDENGKFSLRIADTINRPILIFQTLGYQQDSLQISPNRNDYLIFLKSDSVVLEDIVITGVTRATLIRENPISITTVSPKEIERTTENNVIDALVKNVPGLNAVKTGPNISKPFIHGLGYNRVLTLYDGIRQEGQQYGDEHGLEVDDYNIDRAEVIKGPASLLYGSDAIAGVISLFPKLPKENDSKIHGRLVTTYHTNNNLIGNGLNLNYADDHFLFALGGSYKMAKNYRNPIDGRVYLTNFNERNFSALAGYHSTTGYTHLNFTLYDNHQGIPDGSRDAQTRKFTKQIFEGDDDDITTRPFVTDIELNSYKIPDLSQHIQHYRLYLHSFYAIGKGDIDLILGGQQNIRREFTHPTLPRQAGMYMQLNTVNYGIRYNAPKFTNIETAVGMNGMLQNNKSKDATDFPIPDYDLYDVGTYLYTKWKKERWSISGGIRYDLRHIRWDDFYVGINPQTDFEQKTDANDPKAILQFPSYRKTFHGVSGSIGATFRFSQNLSLKTNIGRAYRSPNITEIGSNGLDPGAHIIYLGNRNFRPEFSLQEDLGISFKNKDISADASFFNNNIQNFIYMAAVADINGNPILDAQGNRTYQYQQSEAHLFGSEIWFAIHPQRIKGFMWSNSISVVYGINKNPIFEGKGIEGEYLPLMPPLKLVSSMEYEMKSSLGKLISCTPRLEMEVNDAQNHYLGLSNTETFTPGYTLFNIGLSAEIKYNETHAVKVTLQANNIFDKAYQSHLNRLKYFEYFSHSTSGHLGIYDMGRNISIKLIFHF